MATTNADILAAINEQGGKLAEINEHLVRVNGTVDANDERSRRNGEKLEALPCTDVQQSVALLEKASERHGVNWGKVTTVGLGLLQAVLLAALLTR